MPPLVLVLGLPVATPLVGFAALTTIIIILAREWRSTNVIVAWRLLVASLLGIPCGLLMLKFAPLAIVKALLGALLIAYSAFSLSRRTLPQSKSTSLVYWCGFAAGVLGGAYNTNAPPVVLYGALAKWQPDRFRATLQGYFLPVGIVICLAHGASDLWSREVIRLYWWSLPGLLAGNWLGVMLARRFDVKRFTRALYILLGLLGLSMFA